MSHYLVFDLNMFGLVWLFVPLHVRVAFLCVRLLSSTSPFSFSSFSLSSCLPSFRNHTQKTAHLVSPSPFHGHKWQATSCCDPALLLLLDHQPIILSPLVSTTATPHHCSLSTHINDHTLSHLYIHTHIHTHRQTRHAHARDCICWVAAGAWE